MCMEQNECGTKCDERQRRQKHRYGCATISGPLDSGTEMVGQRTVIRDVFRELGGGSNGAAYQRVHDSTPDHQQNHSNMRNVRVAPRPQYVLGWA